MSLVVSGFKSWKVSRDNEGHRTYKVRFRIQGQSSADSLLGPAAVLQTLGLPVYGEVWAINSDLDVYAYCKQDVDIEPVVDDGDPVPQWDATYTFSTLAESKRCHENQIDDPLLVPDRVSGDSIRYTQEETTDRFGNPLRTSSHEQLRGPQVEFDHSRDQVVVEQNVADLELATLVAMRDTVNSTEQWGLPARCIKLSSFSWERKYYGTCQVYYTRRLTFETNLVTDPYTGAISSGWDRDLLDEGTKVLHGHWSSGTVGTGSPATDEWVLDNIDGKAPDPSNPGHFDQFKDRNGENARVVLNGAGRPAFTSVIVPGALYMALNNNAWAFPFSNSASWIRVSSVTPVQWQGGISYPAGTIVKDGTQTFVAKTAVTGSTFPPGTRPDLWQSVTTPNSAGQYIPGHHYVTGDVVQSTTTTDLAAGIIHVEKYNESNFFLLNIPTSF